MLYGALWRRVLRRPGRPRRRHGCASPARSRRRRGSRRQTGIRQRHRFRRHEEPAPEEQPLLREREEAIRGVAARAIRGEVEAGRAVAAPRQHAKAARGARDCRRRADGPQPEHAKPKLGAYPCATSPGADWLAIFRRAGKEMLDDNMPMIASALAYSTFFAIPSVLLVAIGLFTLVAGPDTITNLMQHLARSCRRRRRQLLNDSLQRLDRPAGARRSR